MNDIRLLYIDLFCGAGGTSTGVEKANHKGRTRTGCMFCGFGAHMEKVSRFELLYDLHPKAYNVFMAYQNNGHTYREALRAIGVQLPDETPRLFTSKDFQTK